MENIILIKIIVNLQIHFKLMIINYLIHSNVLLLDQIITQNDYFK